MNNKQQLHTSAVVADMATGAEDVETTEKLVKKATRARKPKASSTGSGEDGTVKAKPNKSKKATSSKARSKKAAAVGEDGEVKVKKPKKKAAPSQSPCESSKVMRADRRHTSQRSQSAS